MPNPIECVFCGTSATFRPRTGDELAITCPRCGNYSIVGTAESLLRERRIESPGALSGWIRRQNAMGVTPRIGSEDVDRLRALTKPSFRERAERFLTAAAERAPRLDQWLKVGAPEFIGISYSDDTNELVIILDYLRQQGLLTSESSPQGDRLTPNGYIFADELRAKRAASTQAFVAMWLTDETKPIYENGLELGIRNAGFSAMLIRNKEHANKIDDEIIAEIRRSAFLVADFTGHRQNVYFETGFAIGLGLQVIWTCRKDDIPELHFDIRQYNCIDWEDEAKLAQRLQRRIEALLGRGPLTTG
jgi:nucleoside 2-deoxyribosyltransferase